MAWYKAPIRPYDPVIPADGNPEPIRYLRDTFQGTGQDSFTDPPAQDQGQWEQLINVMPISQGTLSRRWGSQLWSAAQIDAVGTYVGHLYPFQRTDGTRNIIASFAGPTAWGAYAYNEDGTFYSGNLPSRANAGDPAFRVIPSRNYAYFYNGITGNTQKWDGTQNAGMSKWGIDVNGVTNSFSSKWAGAVLSSTGWTSPNSALGTADNARATYGQAAAGLTNVLSLDSYGLSTGGTILGIQADCYLGSSITAVAPKTIRPSASSSTNSGGASGSFTNPSNAWDGNLNTYAMVDASPNNATQTVTETGTIFGFPSIGSPTPATLTLTIKASGGNVADSGATGSGSCAYSLNGGASWNTLFTYGNNGNAGGTYTIPLAATQNTTQIQVRGSATAHNGTTLTGALSSSDIFIYEAYVVATYATGATSVVANAQLLKNGVAYGQRKSFSISPSTNSIYTQGGALDTWQGSWLSSDINASNFGINLSFNTNGGATVNVDAVKLTVYMSGGGPSLGAKSGGSVTLVAGRTYYLAAKNSSTGHYSDLSAASTSTGAMTNQQQALTLPVFTDPQVDTKALLATADGNDPSILYEVVELPNTTTTYTDNTPDTSLVLNQVLLTTDDLGNEIGVSNNTPPPNISLAIKHKGRIWGVVKQNLFFSKSVAELTLPNGFVAGKYEEAWPASNYFDVSAGAENIRALLSDGQTLYIGTERHIYQLYGDTPDNFQIPQIVHQEVGVLNQDVVQPVYLEGAPSGAIWLTPDNRVIGSDFNAYADLGHPVQDVLNNINSSAAQNIAHAMFVSNGEFDLYILAIPTGTNTFCDTHCVFDLRNKQWFIWQPTDPSSAMLFNVNAAGVPQWLWGANFNPTTASVAIYLYTSAATTDRTAINNVAPVVFPVSATTSWMHLGTPTQRKILNEVDIVGDPNMTVTVTGANTQKDFQTPNVVTSNESLTIDLLGLNKLFLAGLNTNYRYFQFTFMPSGNESDFLDSYNILAIPEIAL